ncbi:MAG: hypothetical protein ACFFDK_02310 [Promethearchaeota archaeon]
MAINRIPNAIYHPSIQPQDDLITFKRKEPQISYSTNWTPNGTGVCTYTLAQWYPQICSDDAGGAIIAWRDFRDLISTGTDIYAQRVDPIGSRKWTWNGKPICTADDHQTNLQICSDGDGGAVIAWEDYRGSDIDIYAQKVDSDGNPLWMSNGNVICNATSDQENLQLCSDGDGGAIIAWEDYRGSDMDIYAQWINSSGHTKWGGNGTIICNSNNNQKNAQICSDGEFSAIITWEDYRGSDIDIYAQRINKTGGMEWATNGTAVCTYTNNQTNPQLCSDGASGAIITWKDFRSQPYYDVYAQRINATGGREWTTSGEIICNENWNQENIQICGDDAGGAIIVWDDMRNIFSTGKDIYALRINSEGSTDWTENGEEVCVAEGTQSMPQLTSDEGSGAIITWLNSSGSDSDIYAQRISSTGVTKWAFNGEIISNEYNSQEEPRICKDGSGGAIITWQNNSGSTTLMDILAQRMKNDIPVSINPAPVNTTLSGSHKINWRLSDDGGGGQYRVWANNTAGDIYLWIDWTSWVDKNDTNLGVPINRIATGSFNYTIEYYDDQNQFGMNGSVIVTITRDPIIVVGEGDNDDDDDKSQDTFIDDLIREGLIIPIVGGIVSAVISGFIGILFWKYQKKKEKEEKRTSGV